MKFEATQLGFDNGMGGASNADYDGDLHYVLFGIEQDDELPEQSGVYFEYDDQINGGINKVQEVIIGNLSAEFLLKDGNSIAVDCRKCESQWDEFIVEIRKTFPEEMINRI